MAAGSLRSNIVRVMAEHGERPRSTREIYEYEYASLTESGKRDSGSHEQGGKRGKRGKRGNHIWKTADFGNDGPILILTGGIDGNGHHSDTGKGGNSV